MNETIEIEVVFGDMSDAVEAMGNTAAKSMGMSRTRSHRSRRNLWQSFCINGNGTQTNRLK